MYRSAASIIFLTLSVTAGIHGKEQRLYLDPSQPLNVRIDDLLKRMTLEEKLGQLNIPCVYKRELGGAVNAQSVENTLAEGTDLDRNMDLQAKIEACRRFALGTTPEFKKLGPGGGFFGYNNNATPIKPAEQVKYVNELQELALKKTRLGIPLIQIGEGTHGFECSYATIFPEGLGLGATWNTDLLERIYATVIREARSVGTHALCTLVIEPDIDPRMGRNSEGYSEDPYICSQYAKAIVRGIQSDDISATDKGISVLCHFPGQSNGFAGLEFNAVEMSERAFRNIFLPPWETGLREAGALAVMATHPSYDIFGGVPVHASPGLLTGLLRNELHFQGVVLGEGNSVRTILWKNVGQTQKEAGKLAIDAGLDISISLEPGFMEDMYESVEEGTISIEKVDRAVARLLKLKFMLGLFEDPYVDAGRADRVMHAEEARDLALEAEREAIVLLKNENRVLPLQDDLQSVAVIGPLADARTEQLGDYIPKYIRHEIVTPLEGIRARVSPGTRVTYVKGVEVLNPDFDEIDKAVEAARNSQIAIVCVGETSECNGEKDDVATLDLLGRQRELIQAVQATGTPTIMVLVSGRPLTINWSAKNVPAIIETWFMGEQGGNALAEVLFGDCNPSGRLPITFLRHAGQLPAYYYYKPSKEMRRHAGRGRIAYVDMPMEPIYEFGFGLSYTTFEYSGLKISPEQTGPEGHITVSCQVKNTGKVAGTETVQLYINDIYSSVTTPIRLLKGFRKIFLKPGEAKTVTMLLTPYDLSLLDENLKRVVEPGVFEIMIGKSCEDIQLRGRLTIL